MLLSLRSTIVVLKGVLVHRSGAVRRGFDVLVALAVLVGLTFDGVVVRFVCGVILAVWVLAIGRGIRLKWSDVGDAVIRQRVEVLDDVVAGLSRRPWDATLFPLASRPSEGSMLLLPGAAYHLPEMIELARELTRRGHKVIVGSGDAHFARSGDGLAWYPEVEVVRVDDDTPLDQFAMIVATKDTFAYGRVIERARSAGVLTLAKVEGAQDFDEVEASGPPVRPYRHADLILCQGQNDFEALEGVQREIVGSTRLERLFWAPAVAPRRTLAVVNYNFSYGVRAADAQGWLASATEALREAGIPYIVSVHPAVRISTRTHPWSSVPIARLLPGASVLVSRFSTVPFEAMARGVPFVYHNPHGERMAAFRDPQGAFPVSNDVASLISAIGTLADPGEATRATTRGFFLRQVDIADRRSEERTADLIEALLQGR